MIYKEYIIRFSSAGIFVWRYVITALSRMEAIMRAKDIVCELSGIDKNHLKVIEVIEKDENSVHN